MIPPFDDSGWLPPGIHPAKMSEIGERFGRQSELRRIQMDSVRWMVALAIRAGIQRIILNGSFTTNRIEPNDVDCVLLLPADGARDADAILELQEGLPFMHMALVREKDFEYFVTQQFAINRELHTKGMIEVVP